MANSNHHGLSQESFDQIAKYIKYPETIQAVSKTSRRILFKDMCLYPDDVGGFKRLLKKAPGIARYIQRLTITQLHGLYGDHDYTRSWKIQDLRSVTSNMRNVTTLTIRNWTGCMDLDCREMLKNHFPNVEELKLDRVLDESMEGLFQICGAFTKLRHLHISDLWPTSKLCDPPVGLSLPKLSSLSFTRDSGPSILFKHLVERMMPSSLHRNLHTLDLKNLAEPDIPALQKLLEDLGSGIKSLSIERTVFLRKWTQTPISLAACTGLQTLIIHDNHDEFHAQQLLLDELYDDTAAFLETINSPHLRELCFVEDREPINTELHEMWSKLKLLLSGPKFKEIGEAGLKFKHYEPKHIYTTSTWANEDRKIVGRRPLSVDVGESVQSKKWKKTLWVSTLFPAVLCRSHDKS